MFDSYTVADIKQRYLQTIKCQNYILFNRDNGRRGKQNFITYRSSQDILDIEWLKC